MAVEGPHAAALPSSLKDPALQSGLSAHRVTLKPDGGGGQGSEKLPSVNTASAADTSQRTGLSSTFYKTASIFINEPVGSMSLSPSNRDVVLAARKGLYIVDLESPFAPPRFLAQLSTWEAADVQWSPHPARSHWVASTSNDRLLIWNLDRPEGAPKRPAEQWAGTPNPSAGTFSPLVRRQSLATISPSLTQTNSEAISPKTAQGDWLVPSALHDSSSFRSSAIEYVLSAHTRAITDINFSAHHPDVLASCGIDAWSWVWDLRAPAKPAAGYSAWNAGATQIKWNRSSPHRLATAVTNKVLIWDDRKGALPLATIEAHENQIYGLDWSRSTGNDGLDKLVTCSLDGAVKFWDLSSTSSQIAIGSRSLITEPEQVIQTSTPIWRARHLPFGRGVMTLPQRGDTTLSMWSKDAPLAGPVERFVGHKDIVKEYLFRTRGGADSNIDDRAFQLITWSRDQTLRLWPISEETTRKVGHVPGAPISVLQTRRHAKDITYREAPQERKQDTNVPSPMGGSSGAVTPAHRSSILPPAEATSGLIHGSAGNGTRRSSAVAISPMQQAGGLHASKPASLALGSFSRSAGHSAGESGGVLSTSLPRGPRKAYDASPASYRLLNVGAGELFPGRSLGRSHDTKRSDTRKSTGSGSQGFAAPSRLHVREGQRSNILSTTGSAENASRLSKAGKESRSKKHTKRLQQGAAATYMTRGSGSATGADLLRLRLGRNVGAYDRGSRRKDNAVSWISGVKVERVERRDRRSKSAEDPTSKLSAAMEMTASALTTRPGISQRGLSDGVALPHDDPAAGDENEEDFDIQQEVLDLTKGNHQDAFEKVDIANRTCILNLYGPWAHRSEPAFLRMSLRFPPTYPVTAPKFNLQHNASVSLKTRAFLLRSLRTILGECARQHEGCMQPCANFLVGEPTVEVGDNAVLVSNAVHFEEDSDTDDEATTGEDDEQKIRRGSATGGTRPHVHSEMTRVPPPARSGARFTPTGDLITFSNHHASRHHQGHGRGRSAHLAPNDSARSLSHSRESPMNLLSPQPPVATPSIIAADAALSDNISHHSLDDDETGTVGSSTRGGSGGAGGRFLHSYAELSKAMDSLTRLGNGHLEAEERDAQQGSHNAPDVLSLMTSDFLARRVRGRMRGSAQGLIGASQRGLSKERQSRGQSAEGHAATGDDPGHEGRKTLAAQKRDGSESHRGRIVKIHRNIVSILTESE